MADDEIKEIVRLELRRQLQLISEELQKYHQATPNVYWSVVSIIDNLDNIDK